MRGRERERGRFSLPETNKYKSLEFYKNYHYMYTKNVILSAVRGVSPFKKKMRYHIICD